MIRRIPDLCLGGFIAGNSALLAGTLWVGRTYYPLARTARPEHALHDWLAPGAPWGVFLGLLGTTWMLLMLLYTVRKTLVRVDGLGGLGAWLRFHIACGILGPLFIVVHSGLYAPVGLIGVGFWCMVLVALSGVFGRYVYGLFPRLAGGQALAYDAALRRMTRLRATLVAETASLRGDQVGAAVHLVNDFDAEARTVAELFGVNRELNRRKREIGVLLDASGLQGDVRRQARTTLDEQLRLKRGVATNQVAHRLFRYWHLFHRPLAGAMYAIVAIHILSAVLLGGSLLQLGKLFG